MNDVGLASKPRTRREFLAGAGLTLGALAAGNLLTACGGAGGGAGAASDERLKVAFVYIGPTGDAGWTTSHDEGRKQLEAELGDRVETTFIESVPEGVQSERVFEDLARKGNGLIFGTTFGYMDQMLAVAGKFPDVTFEHCSGFKTAENLGTYFAGGEQAAYLAGMAAGAATKNGKLGYLAPFGIPEVVRALNATLLGARSVRPDATIRVVWTSTWVNPDIEKQAAESLVNSGVDVLSSQQDTPAAGQVAEARGVKWTGYNDNMERFAPEAWLTGQMWNWAPYYIETVRQVLNGTWKSDQYYGSMADDIVRLAPFGKSVDTQARRRIEEKKQAIINGKANAFDGPIKDQNGKVRVPEGKTATLEELLSMDYLVEGVIGKIPKTASEG